MEKGFKKNVHILLGIFAAAMILGMYQSSLFAQVKTATFKTEFEVTEAADGYYILKDPVSGLFGLYDGNGDEVIACEYDEMYFPEDSVGYDYLLVKQGSNWGVLDYKGKTLIDLKYDSIDAYDNGNTVAAAYDGNVTEVFNSKGKQIGTLHGEYSVISDDLFKSEEDIKTLKDSVVLNFEKEQLLFTKKGTDVKVANAEKIGKNIIADFNVGSSDNENVSDEKYGKINTYRYLKVFDESGEQILKITPDEAWTEDEDEEVRGGIRLDRVISDHCVVVRLMGYKKDHLTIYDTEAKEFSSLYMNIGKFYDGKAFAVDEDEELHIINESGKIVSDDPVSIDDYERLGLKKYKNDPFAIFKEKDEDETYRLYSLKSSSPLDTVFLTVTFKRDSDNNEICEGYPLVSNEDKEYVILDLDGSPLFNYGEFDKEDLVNRTIYSDSCVCVVVDEGGKNCVYSYITNESDKESIFSQPFMLAVIGAIVVLLLLIITIIVLLSKKAKARAQERRTFEKRRQLQEEAQKKKERNRNSGLGKGANKFSREPARQDLENTVKLEEPDVIKAALKEDSRPTGQKNVFYGSIHCLAGEFAGAKIALSKDEWIRIGRDENENDLILNNSKVSRKHCAITYDYKTGHYLVIDYSRNGVYLENGTKLVQNQKSIVKEGSVLFLGNDQTVIKLGNNPIQ